MFSPIDFVAGCVGGRFRVKSYSTKANELFPRSNKGAAGVLIGHPFDTIKVIMQTSNTHRTIASICRESSVSFRGWK